MNFFHSIRWRLQLWHGLLLVLVLAGFGFTAWRLQQATRLQRVDQDLERRVAVIAGALRGDAAAPARRAAARPRPRDRQVAGAPPPVPPSEVHLTPRDESLFEGDSGGGGSYYVAWLSNGREAARSVSAPAAVPPPERGDEPSTARSRGELREYVRFMATGDCILVGRDIRDEVAASHRFGWVLGGAVILDADISIIGDVDRIQCVDYDIPSLASRTRIGFGGDAGVVRDG